MFTFRCDRYFPWHFHLFTHNVTIIFLQALRNTSGVVGTVYNVFSLPLVTITHNPLTTRSTPETTDWCRPFYEGNIWLVRRLIRPKVQVD